MTNLYDTRMYMLIYSCTHAFMQTPIHPSSHPCMQAYTDAHVHIHTHMLTYSCVFVLTYTHPPTCLPTTYIYLCTCIHTYLHPSIHPCVHTCTKISIVHETRYPPLFKPLDWAPALLRDVSWTVPPLKAGVFPVKVQIDLHFLGLRLQGIQTR